MPKVFILGSDWGISKMFLVNGWSIAADLNEGVDLIQFTGGEDVDPSYYKEGKHPATRSNPVRDARESLIYREFVGKVPLAGICRGAQFLNVMNGGRMWQHVTNHAIGGTHEAFDRVSEQPLQVTSTHHQMMIPADHAKVLMIAQICETKQGWEVEENGFLAPDIEAVLYPDTHCLCYQPHPEYVNINHDCQITYFKYLNRFLMT